MSPRGSDPRGDVWGEWELRGRLRGLTLGLISALDRTGEKAADKVALKAEEHD